MFLPLSSFFFFLPLFPPLASFPPSLLTTAVALPVTLEEPWTVACAGTGTFTWAEMPVDEAVVLLDVALVSLETVSLETVVLTASVDTLAMVEVVAVAMVEV